MQTTLSYALTNAFSRTAWCNRLALKLRSTRRAVHNIQKDWEEDLPAPPHIPKIEDKNQSVRADLWIRQFKLHPIPKSFVKLTYSRSSGPGGQNVNKVNTKATLRVSLWSPWIPLWAHEHVKKTPSYVSSTQSILITSTLTRSQAENTQDCLAKLHSLIVSAATASLIKEESNQTKARREASERKEEHHRRQEKKRQREVKRSRSGRNHELD